jgi:predicted ArsR family transcriptional regulator
MDGLQAIGDPELRRALLAVRSVPGPVSVDQLADVLGVHRNVARARLDRLVEAGLLDVRFERPAGRGGPGAGRPARVYSVTPELTALEFPLRRYGALVDGLIEALPARGRSKRLREAGVAFGRELAVSAALEPAASLPEAAADVCAALGELGFHAAVEAATDQEAWIRTATCPVRPLVQSGRTTIPLDHGMWAGLVAAALDGVEALDVECQGQGCLDPDAACRVRIRVRPVSRRR